nr:MAG: ribosomal biogenesis protein [Vulcanisaeta sp. AZ3]
MGPVILTSSRDSSTRMRQFLNELELAIPNAVKFNRGRQSIIELASKALGMGITRIIYFGAKGGNPGFIKFLRIKERTIELLPYLVRIHSVKLLLDMQVKVKQLRKPHNGIILSLGVYTEVIGVLSEQLELSSLVVQDLESIKGMYDTILLIHRVNDEYELQILDGKDLGPRGPFMKISDIIYTRPRVIEIE